jgi:hypothetical protein
MNTNDLNHERHEPHEKGRNVERKGFNHGWTRMGFSMKTIEDLTAEYVENAEEKRLTTNEFILANGRTKYAKRERKSPPRAKPPSRKAGNDLISTIIGL